MSLDLPDSRRHCSSCETLLIQNVPLGIFGEVVRERQGTPSDAP